MIVCIYYTSTVQVAVGFIQDRHISAFPQPQVAKSEHVPLVSFLLLGEAKCAPRALFSLAFLSTSNAFSERTHFGMIIVVCCSQPLVNCKAYHMMRARNHLVAVGVSDAKSLNFTNI